MKKLITLFKAVVLIVLLICQYAMAADSESIYIKLATDKLISTNGPVTVLTSGIYLSVPKKIFIQADGRFLSSSPRGLGKLNLRVDNNYVGNDAILDWLNTTRPAQHSFNCIALVELSAGYHTIELVGGATGSSKFIVGARSSVSILVNPAPNVTSASTTTDSGILSETTYPLGSFSPLPMTTILTNSISASTEMPLVSVSAGRDFSTYDPFHNLEGDALWGIFLDNETCLSNDKSSWSVNDLMQHAELMAPLFTQAYHTVTAGDHGLYLKVGELGFNYIENQLKHRVAASTQLISMWGMGLSGKATASTANCNREDWYLIGMQYPGAGDPLNGTIMTLASTTVTIPPGHNGIVQFLAKTRVQGRLDHDPEQGNVYIWINIDGVDVGSLGVQQIVNGAGDSSRTISSAYLSSGANALTPGNHTVTVYVQTDAISTFQHMCVSKDIPLIYFD